MKSLLMQGSAVNVQVRALSYDESNTAVRQQDTAHTDYEESSDAGQCC